MNQQELTNLVVEINCGSYDVNAMVCNSLSKDIDFDSVVSSLEALTRMAKKARTIQKKLYN
jgi:hypothetical protein